MDRIERFLGRRPVKGRRKVQSQGKEFLITKEDVKLIRSYKKNICMDPDVDLYRPLNLSFSRKTMNEGMETRKKVVVPRAGGRPKKKERSIRKEVKKRDKNEIVDIWEEEGLEELNSYEQDMVVKVGDAYTGAVEALRYGREDLEGSLRRIYLRLYEPRDGKNYRLRDLIKELPKTETLRPFPEEIGLSFKFSKAIRVGISQDFKKFGVGEGRKLGIYEFKNFVKLRHILFDSEIRKIMFARNGSICTLLADNTICVVDDIYGGDAESSKESFISKEFPAWSRKEAEEGAERNAFVCTVINPEGKINDIEAHEDGKHIIAVCGKKIMVYNLKERIGREVLRVRGATPLKAKFHRSLSTMIVSTTNSLIIYDLVSKEIVREAKEFSFVLDFFSVEESKVAVVNNTNKIILYDWLKNNVQRTMLQEDVGMEVVQHGRLNLMCVAYPTEMVVFYNDVTNDLVVPVKRIPGRYRDISFHPHLPWLYGVGGNRLDVFT
ncbi:uncharacterized protein Eint_021030 [Encephalitozoon intestinalis ATCC 50506]|uniref:WD40 domain-containing protein n=1 Tax=Encephalitozoon intestinalis (strain ATCC 50506) TaxID=876142 RepID=E0S5W5_ENCIT|nr:uncharacterized protein Eint_021030 [Encephalitozoon intestinalis ATCC 50506]ADM11100.1 hypothetical protein Eint_021030 [Encephalitozoon intestinalis ATCC 50506]UTX44754.1 WD40 domain-containing protein [Encephalitozoon intestinalis]